MFSVRLVEHPLPTTERDVDGLIACCLLYTSDAADE